MRDLAELLRTIKDVDAEILKQNVLIAELKGQIKNGRFGLLDTLVDEVSYLFALEIMRKLDWKPPVDTLATSILAACAVIDEQII